MAIEFKREFKQYLSDMAGLTPNSASQYLSYLNNLERRTGIPIAVESALAIKEEEIWRRLNAIIDAIDGGKKPLRTGALHGESMRLSLAGSQSMTLHTK